MNFKSTNNKYLKVSTNVVLTSTIDNVITSLDPYFERCPAVVTSGFRDGARQLKVIISYLKVKGIINQYSGCENWKVTDMDPNNKANYIWQMAWSHLLSVGVIINPPVQAKCLRDYFRNGKNLKGVMFNQTPHATGKAFNIGGSSNGPADEAQCIERAIADKLPGIVNYVFERENNCIHVNCK